MFISTHFFKCQCLLNIHLSGYVLTHSNHSQIKYVCGEASSLPTVPSHLMEAFTDSLEKLSVAKVEEGGMAVIVIDGADLIKVGHTHTHTK